MSTAIRETTSPAFHELGLVPVEPAPLLVELPAPVPVPLVRRSLRIGSRALDSAPRPLAERRPRDGRPGGAAPAARPGAARSAAAHPPQGAHPLDTRVLEAQVGFAVLAVAALLSALAVTSLILLAQWRAGSFGVQPATTPVVVEQLPVSEPGQVR
ncbi:hypothetical protein [Nocardia sp. NPDC048505]|uniref:hypothetical protein n=1 Tax=unclassified Nocardia TaxID=2637762 RepID=UPI0033CC386C